MTLSIIIVNYNVKYYLEQCLHSVWKAVEGIDNEVFVVDNASKDDSVAYLKTKFPQQQYPHLHIIANRHNLGFGKANNLALKKATGEFILFLNPDTILTEHTLHDCIAFARTRPDLGGLGVKMLRDNGEFALESRRSLPTPWTSFCKITGLATLFPKSKLFGKYNLRFLSEDESSQIDIISGAFLFAKHEVLKKTGGFDEQFFMYGEDIDLSYRILKAGYKNYYLPTPILHYKGESTHKNSFRYVHVFYEAMLIFFRKHYRHYSLLLSIPIMAAIILSACLSLVSRQLRRFKRFLFPKPSNAEERCYYNGTHLDDFLRLNMPLTEDASKALYFVYDTADLSYDEILSRLSNSDHKHYLGTFFPKEKILITAGDVFH